MEPKQKLSIWGFIKGAFKVIIGLSLFLQSLMFFVFLVVVLGVMGMIAEEAAGPKSSKVAMQVEEGAALLLNPKGILVEQAQETDQFEQALAEAYGASQAPEVEVHNVVYALRQAAKDDRVKGLVLDLSGLYIPGAYASKAHYITAEIDKFKATGKPVIAIGDYYSQETYMLAAHADTIMMHDYGSVFIIGYGRYGTFYKSLLEKLKINTHIFRVGTFKSAVEPLIRDDMSEPAKEANLAYLGVLWREYVANVETARGLNAGTISNYANNLDVVTQEAGGDLAKAALTTGLVDKLTSRAEQTAYLTEAFGESEDEDKDFKYVQYRAYLAQTDGRYDEDDADPNIAILTAAGTILDGEQPVGTVGGDTLSRQIKQAREDEDVKAIVLRVDSPGGSAFASEIIRDELLAVKAAGKPVVVSMGSLAASGGYWISANADEIWAAPTTITGSIGIFGVIQTLENTAAEVGVFVDGVGTTEMSSLHGAGLGPLPEKFKAVIQANIEQGYDRFMEVVSSGRGITKEQVNEIGQGRVWIGETASQINLVDKLGTIDDAIKSAAAKAGIEGDYDVVQMREPKTRLQRFVESLTGASIKAGLIKHPSEKLFAKSAATRQTGGLTKIVKEFYSEVKFQESFNDPNNVYLRCLECELD
ncbi:MAG: signal peptide peptidase SppA [Parvularculaceae bacterium]